MTRIAVTALYALSLLLPVTGLMLAYFRSRRILRQYAENDRKEALIDAKYSPRLKELRAEWEEILNRPNAHHFKDERHAVEQEQKLLEEQRSADYKANGVDVLTYARLDELIQPALRDRPDDRFHLAKREIIFVGTGIVLGTAASIWSVWI